MGARGGGRSVPVEAVDRLGTSIDRFSLVPAGENGYGAAMQTPEHGVADALSDLTEQTRLLVRREVAEAQEELWDKAKRALPVAGLLGAAALSGLFAAASAYRLGMRVLERLLSPGSAALVATIGYGAAAGLAGSTALSRLRALPAPLPSETASHTAATVTESIAAARSAGAARTAEPPAPS